MDDEDTKLSRPQEISSNTTISTLHLAEAVLALLGHEPVSEEERSKHRDTIARSTRRLIALIDPEGQVNWENRLSHIFAVELPEDPDKCDLGSTDN